MLGLVAIVQFVLHYLGWLGIVLGIVALLFRNTDRGIELIVGGFGIIVLKYVLGSIFVGLSRLFRKGDGNL